MKADRHVFTDLYLDLCSFVLFFSVWFHQNKIQTNSINKYLLSYYSLIKVFNYLKMLETVKLDWVIFINTGMETVAYLKLVHNSPAINI